MSHNSVEATPYERFLRQNLDDEKKRLEQLTARYTRAGPIKRFQLKKELDLVNQNVRLLSADLDHYLRGLVWLREPSKERDEKAESLKPVSIEAITGGTPGPGKPTGASPQNRSTAPSVGRPTIGRPLVQPGAQNLPTPVGQQASTQSSQPAPKPAVAVPRVGAPIGKPLGTQTEGKPVGTPVRAPQVGKPVGKTSNGEGEEVAGNSDQKNESSKEVDT